MFCFGFDGHQPTKELRDLLQFGVQHVILFARNVRDGQQVFELTAQFKRDASHPIMICVDQEGGRVRRPAMDLHRSPPCAPLAKPEMKNSPAVWARLWRRAAQ